MSVGFKIFAAAITLVLQNPRTAIKVIAAPVALAVSIEILLENFVQFPELREILAFLFSDTLLVAMIAVGWHRFGLLGQPATWWGAQFAGGRLGRYALWWVILGLIAFVGAAILFLGVYFIARGPIGSETLDQILFRDSFDSVPFLSRLSLWVSVFLCVFVMTWTLFRLALILPQIAIGERLKDSSWRATARLEPGIAVCAFLAAAGTFILYLPMLSGVLYPDYDWMYSSAPEFETEQFSVVYLAVMRLGNILVVLFGAAILTEIYRHVKMPAARGSPPSD